jgi:DnaJ-class molecular chaperone
LALKNLYSVLNLADFASIEDVKLAYRQLAKIHHPDVAINHAKDFFLELSLAYEILSDKTKKEGYDEALKSKIENKILQNRPKIRADKIWIAKYKAEQKIKNTTETNIKTESNGLQRYTHFLLIALCVLITFLLTYFLFTY